MRRHLDLEREPGLVVQRDERLARYRHCADRRVDGQYGGGRRCPQGPGGLRRAVRAGCGGLHHREQLTGVDPALLGDDDVGHDAEFGHPDADRVGQEMTENLHRAGREKETQEK